MEAAIKGLYRSEAVGHMRYAGHIAEQSGQSNPMSGSPRFVSHEKEMTGRISLLQKKVNGGAEKEGGKPCARTRS